MAQGITESIVINIDGDDYDGRLATIKTTSLGYEDHGIPTAMLHCDGDGWGQGAGGWNLRGEAMSVFVCGVLDCLGLGTWEKVAGQKVMLLYRKGSDYPVEGIKPVVGGHAFLFREAMEQVGRADVS